MMERKWKLQFKVFGLGFMLGTASTLYQSLFGAMRRAICNDIKSIIQLLQSGGKWE